MNVVTQLWRHGPEITDTGVRYHFWSPEVHSVSVTVTAADSAERRILELHKDHDGWFSVEDAQGRAGDLYLFKLDDKTDLPDVASRYQPEGVRGPSQVVDSRSFQWRNPHWRSPKMEDLVIYELHLGTFTPEGTFLSAMERLDYLKELGVNAIEIMPVNAFPGARNWGYDTVLPYAPADCYGTPDDFRRLIDAAHGKGLVVILDVVYNHVCGEPNLLEASCAHYFHEEKGNEWGKCLNFDGEHSDPVREYFLQNIIYWMEEFRVDGFRLDAVHAIHDKSSVHILEEITQAVHARSGIVIAEDNSNDASRLRKAVDGGFGMNAMWADDFHHVMKMCLKPEHIAHFKSYEGTVDELVKTLNHGWLYRGQSFPYWGRTRGTECNDLHPSQFVYCISNHDQAGNRPLGERLNHLISPEAYRAASMLFLLSPYTPMLFMGQEWSASSPFVFFSNHGGKFGEGVSIGRCREFKQFGAEWPETVIENMPDPEMEQSFKVSKLNWEELIGPAQETVLLLYKQCFRLRREDPILALRDREHWRVWSENNILFLQYADDKGGSRLLVTCLWSEVLTYADWPLCVPWGKGWSVMMSSEEEGFGGKNGEHFDVSNRRFSFDRPISLLLASEA
ncbi:MAG TPA: malto-oligosyltrehalose trehalohydrolase [Verrucomicrobiae bacterium]